MKFSYLIDRVVNIDFQNLNQTLDTVSKRSGKGKLSLVCDMAWCGLKYGAGYTDYTYCQFYKLNGDKRKTYLTRTIQNELVRKLNDRRFYHCFQNKLEFNQLFSPLVTRPYLDVRDVNVESFRRFLKGRSEIIAKPVDGIGGHGVKRIAVDENTDVEQLYNSLLEEKRTLVEEVIQQHHALQELYPQGVNTVRVVTILTGTVVDIMWVGLKIGSNGSVVDNVAEGGICAWADRYTGVITTPASNYDVMVFENHPNTGVKIVGFQIPNFDAVKEVASTAARLIPEIRYVGWDIAVTEDGAQLIEGNEYPGHLLMQIPVHLKDAEGLLPRFQKYLK